jgi:hypothetical protein
MPIFESRASIMFLTASVMVGTARGISRLIEAETIRAAQMLACR